MNIAARVRTPVLLLLSALSTAHSAEAATSMEGVYTDGAANAHCIVIQKAMDLTVNIYVGSKQARGACYLEGTARAQGSSLKMNHEEILQLMPGEEAEVQFDKALLRVRSNGKHVCGQAADLSLIAIPRATRKPLPASADPQRLETLCLRVGP